LFGTVLSIESGEVSTMFVEVGRMNPLRKARVLQEKSIHFIALKTSIDSGKLSLIERGLREPTRDEKRRLAKALSARIRDLFPKEGFVLTKRFDEKLNQKN